jgi:hypothetical protein
MSRCDRHEFDSASHDWREASTIVILALLCLLLIECGKYYAVRSCVGHRATAAFVIMAGTIPGTAVQMNVYTP